MDKIWTRDAHPIDQMPGRRLRSEHETERLETHPTLPQAQPPHSTLSHGADRRLCGRLYGALENRRGISWEEAPLQGNTANG